MALPVVNNPSISNKTPEKSCSGSGNPAQVCGISLAVDREFRAINDVFVTYDPDKTRGTCAEPNGVKANFTLRLHSVSHGVGRQACV